MIAQPSVLISTNLSQLNPEQIAKLTALRDSLINTCQFIWDRMDPLIAGGVAGFSQLNLLNIILLGVQNGSFEQNNPEVMIDIAKYLVVPIALLSATNKILDQYNVPHHLHAQAFWNGAVNMVSFNTFTAQLINFLIGQVGQFIQGNDNPVDISNWAESLALGGVFSIGILEGIKVYFSDLERRKVLLTPTIANSENEFRLTRVLRTVSQHPIVVRGLDFINGASSAHAFVGSLESAVGVASSQTASTIRYVLTAVGALIALGLSSSPNTATTQFLKNFLDILKVVPLALSAYSTFGLAQSPKEWGKDTVLEQAYFWLLALPLFTISLQVLMHCIGFSRTTPQDLPVYRQIPSDDTEQQPLLLDTEEEDECGIQIQEEYIQEEHVQEEHVREERVQEERVQEERVQEERVQEEHVQEEHVQEEHVQEEHVKEEHVQEEHVQKTSLERSTSALINHSMFHKEIMTENEAKPTTRPRADSTP